MPVITLMTVFGIKDGTVGVVKRVSGEICPRTQISNIVSNAMACLGVKAGDIIEAHFPHD
jgi:S-adenosylmethionine hydrolase